MEIFKHLKLYAVPTTEDGISYRTQKEQDDDETIANTAKEGAKALEAVAHAEQNHLEVQPVEKVQLKVQQER